MRVPKMTSKQDGGQTARAGGKVVPQRLFTWLFKMTSTTCPPAANGSNMKALRSRSDRRLSGTLLRSRSGWRLSICLVACVCLAGCGEDTRIRTYKVAKQDSVRKLPMAGSQSNSVEREMLGAIVPNASSAWFFKLTGEPDAIDRQGTEFRSIVDSVSFKESGDPTWKLSDGWSQKDERGITYARLRQEESGLEATVTTLPVMEEHAQEEGWRDYVVQNINRWRGQLSLEAQSWESMAEELEEVPELSQGPKKAYFVRIVGKGAGSMGGPFMNQFGGSVAPAGSSNPPAPQAPATQAQSELQYAVPEGWSEQPPSGMRRASFTLSKDDRQAEVSVIAAGGSREANVGIWLGQVGREATEEAKQSVLAAAQDVLVNAVESKLYTIDGLDSETPKSIAIVDVPWKSGESLFIKLTGDPPLVAAEREKFQRFVESVKW